MKANSFVSIDTDAYRHNIHYLSEVANKKMMAIIKANGYGLVDHIVAKIAMEEGVDFFGVSSLLEAINLRRNLVSAKILVLGYVPKEDIREALLNDVAITTVSKDYIYSIDKKDLFCLKVHLAIDTGMHRIGILEDEIDEVLAYLKENGAIVEGIFTHFAKSDDDIDFTVMQYERFKRIVKHLDHHFTYIHTANTDATIRAFDDISTHVRCGIGLLGYASVDQKLKPCVSLYSTVTNCRLVKKGEGIGYGQTYHLDHDAYIITLAIGYADGLLRINKGRKVYVDGHYIKIVGNICMDQLMCESEVPIKVTSDVEIFGEHISLYDMAKELNTIPYEILTGLSDRLERRYYKDGKLYLTYDPRFK